MSGRRGDDYRSGRQRREDREDADRRVREALAGTRQTLGSGEGSFGARRVRAPCPFCEEERGKRDRKMALSIERATGLFYCWRCGTGGRLLGDEFLEPDAVAAAEGPRCMVVDAAGNVVPRPVLDSFAHLGPPDGYVELGRGDAVGEPLLAWAHEYAARRGITPEMADVLQVGACWRGKLAGRIILPALLPDDATDAAITPHAHVVRGQRWVGWVARDATGTRDRTYLTAPDMPRGEWLWNHGALLAPDDGEPVILVEGSLDAIPFHPNGAAFLGKIGAGQYEALLACDRPLVVALDGDAWREGLALAWRLQFDGKRAAALHLPPETDPDEVAEWVREEARAAVRAM